MHERKENKLISIKYTLAEPDRGLTEHALRPSRATLCAHRPSRSKIDKKTTMTVETGDKTNHFGRKVIQKPTITVET